jgi:2-polyprenyl-6-methoxyphenol hydroxylase-like FAD-dependent oxidoreductase
MRRVVLMSTTEGDRMPTENEMLRLALCYIADGNQSLVRNSLLRAKLNSHNAPKHCWDCLRPLAKGHHPGCAGAER